MSRADIGSSSWGKLTDDTYHRAAPPSATESFTPSTPSRYRAAVNRRRQTADD